MSAIPPPHTFQCLTSNLHPLCDPQLPHYPLVTANPVGKHSQRLSPLAALTLLSELNLRTQQSQQPCSLMPSNLSTPDSSVSAICSDPTARPRYLPLGWSSHIHPEGQLFFSCDAPLKIVTEEHLYTPEILERVLHWTQEIDHAIRRSGIPSSDNFELSLALDADDESSCLYYFVDHSTRSTFWLEPIPTTLLGMSPVVSTSHLKLALEEQYWNHVEYFPTQLKASNIRAVDDLISVFTHGQAGSSSLL